MAQPQQQFIVTPWRTHSELLQIRHDLYTPSTPSSLSSALLTVRAWKLRGSLPHAVESTYLLLRAQQFHTNTYPANSSNEDDFPLRATYSAALTRFVTGYADLGRHRAGQPGRSMLEVARGIALPPRFVEMRHEAAHEDLPSLPRLEVLAREALEWLWGAYWASLEERGQGKVLRRRKADGEVREECRARLRVFRKARVKALQAGTTEEENLSLVDTTVEELTGFADAIKQGYSILAKCLCTPSMLIPTATTQSELDSRIDTAFAIWEQLLWTLATKSRRFMKPFLATLAHVAAGEGVLKVEHRGLVKWLERIFDSPGWCKVLGPRRQFLLAHTMKACLLGTEGLVESSEAVCKMLLDIMRTSATPDFQMWTDMYMARFEHLPDSSTLVGTTMELE